MPIAELLYRFTADNWVMLWNEYDAEIPYWIGQVEDLPEEALAWKIERISLPYDAQNIPHISASHPAILHLMEGWGHYIDFEMPDALCFAEDEDFDEDCDDEDSDYDDEDYDADDDFDDDMN